MIPIIRQTDDYAGQGSGQITCRAGFLGPANLVECHTKEHPCHWHLSFGHGLLCTHPSKTQIASKTLAGTSTTGHSDIYKTQENSHAPS